MRVNNTTVKALRMLSFSLVLLLILLISRVTAFAEEIKVSVDETIITLSPKVISKNQKKLKGYKVHTVLWYEGSFLGLKNARNSEKDDTYEFTLDFEDDVKKDQYIEVIGTVGSKNWGNTDIYNSSVLSTKDKAKSVLQEIKNLEKEETPDIKAFTDKVDGIKRKKKEEKAQKESEQFFADMKETKADFVSSDATTLTPKQLDKKRKELDGKQFHSVFHISDVSKDSLEAYEKEGKWSNDFSLDFDWDYDLRKYVKEDDVVEIVGVVDRGFWGEIYYENCKILSIGEEAKTVLEEINTKDKKDKDSKTNKQTTQTGEEPVSDGNDNSDNEESIGSQIQEEGTFTSIARGDSGDSVREAQIQLAALGFLTSSVDGKFGPGTEQAVKDFQYANGLEPTGTIDKITYEAMLSASASSEPEPEPEPVSFTPIRRGDSGDPVIEIQKRLAELGYLTSSVDGKFGPGTEQAVVNFQSANYLETYGIVDESTYDKMFSPDAIKYEAPILKSDIEENTADVGTRSFSDPLVWIPNSGSKYHSNSGCSRMKNPTQVTRSQAEAMGFTPCSKCY